MMLSTYEAVSMFNLNRINEDVVTEPKCLASERQKKKSSNWLVSLARSKSVKRTSLRFQRWLSSDSISRPDVAATRNIPCNTDRSDNDDYGFKSLFTNTKEPHNPTDIYLDRDFFSTVSHHEKLAAKSSAEFYPGALMKSSAVNATNNNSESSTKRAVRRSVSDRRFPVRRSQSYCSHTRNFVPFQSNNYHGNAGRHLVVNSCGIDVKLPKRNFQNGPQQLIYNSNPLAREELSRHRETRARNLCRSSSMSAHLVSNRGSSARDQPLKLIRSCSREALVGHTARSLTGHKENVVFHYPPNGCHNRLILHVPKVGACTDVNHLHDLNESQQRSRNNNLSCHERRSQSLDTLLEEISDSSSSPLPPPVFETYSRQTYVDDLFPEYDIPSNNAHISYKYDDYVSPVSQVHSKLISPIQRNTMRTGSTKVSEPFDINKTPARPHVASFSSSSPDSNDEQLFHENSQAIDVIYARPTNSLYSTHHNNVPGTDLSYQDSALIHKMSKSQMQATLSSKKKQQTPTSQNAERLRSAYHCRVEQLHRFPRRIHPSFVPAEVLAALSTAKRQEPRSFTHVANRSHRQPPLPDVLATSGPCQQCAASRNGGSRLRDSLFLAGDNGMQETTGPQSGSRRLLTRRLSLVEPIRQSPSMQQRCQPTECGNGAHLATHLATQLSRVQRSQLSDRCGLVVNQRAPLGCSSSRSVGGRHTGSANVVTDQTAACGTVDHLNTSTNNNPAVTACAVRLYGQNLTAYERSEIGHYDQIWYVGAVANKILAPAPDIRCDSEPAAARPDSSAAVFSAAPGTALINHGYDDDGGNYIKVNHDHIAYRYEVLDIIGKGSFGQVIKALDHKTGFQVAIKIIRNKKRFHQQALMEVKILDHLRRVDQQAQEMGGGEEGGYNVVRMLECFYFRDHLCVVFQLLGLNLYELIKKNNYRGISLSLIKKFAASMLQCLQLLQREGIIHCDLKPENVLLKSKNSTSIRIIDFGSSCYSHQRVYTYIQSRFYRSPEVILGLPYDTSIDMWSFGCILAELYTGFPLFPGENEVEQLSCIMECLDLPPERLILHASRRRLFFDSRGLPRTITNSKGRRRRPGGRPLSTAIKCCDAAFLDLVQRCLTWDPGSRITPDQAFRHPFISTRASAAAAHDVLLPARVASRDAAAAAAAAADTATTASRAVQAAKQNAALCHHHQQHHHHHQQQQQQQEEEAVIFHRSARVDTTNTNKQVGTVQSESVRLVSTESQTDPPSAAVSGGRQRNRSSTGQYDH